jgi:hypothetical protein
VAGCVQIHHAQVVPIAWEAPIALPLIDGPHDYVSTTRDFLRFEPFVRVDGLAPFHD